jgi:hypothetical protein
VVFVGFVVDFKLERHGRQSAGAQRRVAGLARRMCANSPRSVVLDAERRFISFALILYRSAHPLSVFLSLHARAPWVQSLELATAVAPSSSSNNSRTTCSQYRAMPPPPKHAAASEAAMAARAQTAAACGQRATSHREPSRVLPRPRTSQELLCRCRCRSPPELR